LILGSNAERKRCYSFACEKDGPDWFDQLVEGGARDLMFGDKGKLKMGTANTLVLAGLTSLGLIRQT